MQKEQKLKELFLLTAFCCCFVVLAHTSSEGVTSLRIGSWQQAVFFVFNKAATFVVPGFIFLSGLKLTYSYREKEFHFVEFIQKRLSKILIPYFCWYVAYYILFRLIGLTEPKSISQHIFSIIMGDLVAPFYFITTIFQFYILFGVFLYLLKNVNTILLFCICFAVQLYYLEYIYPMYEDRFFMTYLIYFLLGGMMALHLQQFQRAIRKYGWVWYICFIFLTYWHTTHAYASNVQGIFYAHWRIFTCLFSLSGIIALYHISDYITQRVPEKWIAFFKAVDASSYYIFLTHCFLLYIFNGFWGKVGLESIFPKFILNSVLILFFTFFFSFIYITWKKKWYSIKKKV